jgi:hypothetical protein
VIIEVMLKGGLMRNLVVASKKYSEAEAASGGIGASHMQCAA